MKTPFGTGADTSHYDPRTWQHDTALAGPITVGGVKYLAADIGNQAKEGICTAISLTQLAGKARGKRYSAEFQYLLQKRFYDLAWYEGSSIFVALKVGKKYGFLEEKNFPYAIDRNLPYPEYAAKLAAIPSQVVDQLIKLCVDPLSGYGNVDLSSAESFAKAIADSKAGVLCRYSVGNEWWTPSWRTKDIDPIRPPQQVVSGHAIIASYFDLTGRKLFFHPNTWSTAWNDENVGSCNIDFDQYRPTEAWIPYFDAIPPVPPFSHFFGVDLAYGQNSTEVEALQIALQKEGDFPANQSITGFFGDKTQTAVQSFQKRYGIASWGTPWLNGYGRVGPKTRAKLNALYYKP